MCDNNSLQFRMYTEHDKHLRVEQQPKYMFTKI